jgi:hypothetical protein
MSGTDHTQREVRLSKDHFDYLTNTMVLPENLEELVARAKPPDGTGGVVRLDVDTAERFRDQFTARLAHVGFGQDYRPTAEGRLLEDLIDRFGP